MIALFTILAVAAAIPLAMRKEPEARAEKGQNGVRLLAVNVGKADSLILWVDSRTYLIDTGTVQSWGALRAALNAARSQVRSRPL
jgi:hypothetical protein